VNLLDLLCCWDLVTPGKALVDDMINGPATVLGVDERSGLDRRDIANILKRNGIDCWGVVFTRSGITVSVRDRDAGRAERVLRDHGARMLRGR